jgi:hypothetical protein
MLTLIFKAQLVYLEFERSQINYLALTSQKWHHVNCPTSACPIATW